MTAASARYGRSCPACHAEADQPCRTLGTGRVTDTHAARIGRWEIATILRQFHMAYTATLDGDRLETPCTCSEDHDHPVKEQ